MMKREIIASWTQLLILWNYFNNLLSGRRSVHERILVNKIKKIPLESVENVEHFSEMFNISGKFILKIPSTIATSFDLSPNFVQSYTQKKEVAPTTCLSGKSPCRLCINKNRRVLSIVSRSESLEENFLGENSCTTLIIVIWNSYSFQFEGLAKTVSAKITRWGTWYRLNKKDVLRLFMPTRWADWTSIRITSSAI